MGYSCERICSRTNGKFAIEREIVKAIIMLINDVYKPIRNFGYFFVILGCLGFITMVTKLLDLKYLLIVWIFVGSVSIFHFLMGIGLVYKKRWAFMVFKGYLNFIYLGYPLGTYLSRMTKEYIDRNNIERFLK